MLFGTETFETQILGFLQNIFKCPFLDFTMPYISMLGNAGLVWIFLTVILMISKHGRKTGFTLAIALILCLLAGNLLLKPLIARPRPFTIDSSIQLLIAAPKDFSFPSGHTLSSFASAFVLLFSIKNGTKKHYAITALVLATLIALSRLYLCVHYPSDVILGIVLGYFIAKLSLFIVTLKQKKL